MSFETDSQQKNETIAEISLSRICYITNTF